jgi:acyl-CoA synthetase (AMP-forming)/AMP-acid ligase II
LEINEDIGPLTAEALLRRRAAQRPGVAAVSDPLNLEVVGLGRPRTFSYAQADAAVDALAGFFIELGLMPGDVVAMQLPNTALAPLTILAAWRAGLTVAALPMLWRAHEIGEACAATAPKALIGVSRCEGEPHAERLCAIAAAQISVRFVLCFGPDLPDGVVSLDEVVEGASAASRRIETLAPDAPAMITFTARAGMPLIPLARSESELLAQGAMTVLALSLERSDAILNPYPLTGPVGLALGLMPWLIAGATLAQHHPFDYAAYVEQLLGSGATVSAVPAPVLAALAKDGVLQQPQSRLRRLGAVWTTPNIVEAPAFNGAAPLLFDLYPLGDLASLVLRREALRSPEPVPLGPIHLEEDGEDVVFAETKLGPKRDADGYGELLLRGAIVPKGDPDGRLAPDSDGFIGTGLRAALAGSNGLGLRLKGDPELLRHGGVSIATAEFDALYRDYPGFLDAACFVLPDPVMGDRVFAAVVPRPGEAVSLEALTQFLAERGVAPYKFPDRLLVVKQIPRDASGRVLRDQILKQV